MDNKPTSWEEWKKEFNEAAVDGSNYDIYQAESLCKSPIEMIAYMILIKLYNSFGLGQIKVIPQADVLGYRVDFLVVFQPIFDDTQELEIVIECDGHEWHEKSKEKVIKDKQRERLFIVNGYLILRYSGSEIVNDPWEIESDVRNSIFEWWTRLKK